MNTHETDKAIEKLQAQIAKKREKINKLRKKRKAEEVIDYVLKDINGKKVMLSSLFGDGEELILVHNMGKACPYCTLWADGFSSLNSALQDRVPFVLVSPDSPATIKQFSSSRKWAFPCYSAAGSTFIADMGYAYEKEGKVYYHPGVSSFIKKKGKIYRANKDYFGPGDTYNIAWHFFDLLPKGDNDWIPKYKY